MILTEDEIRALISYAASRPYLQVDCAILLDRTGRFGETTRRLARACVVAAVALERRRWERTLWT